MTEKHFLRSDQSFAAREKNPEWKFLISQENWEWKWLLQDSESATIAESRRRYRTREDCERAIAIIKLKILKAGIEGQIAKT